MQRMTIHDTEITINGWQLWLPLENILDEFVDMIDQGEALAVNEDHSGDQKRTQAWIKLSYTAKDHQDPLQAFQQLVDIIHTRMPSQPQNNEQGLFDIVTDGNPDSLPPNSFTHRFLAQCSRLAFTNITPSLSIAQHQPFDLVSEQVEANKLYPLLLFSSTSFAYEESRRAP